MKNKKLYYGLAAGIVAACLLTGMLFKDNTKTPVLTLLVLPTMYAAWFKVKPNSQFPGNLTVNGRQTIDLN
ncbi:MAG: hypothetical protein WC601_03260 [Desulfotomaculaceae bacterium]